MKQWVTGILGVIVGGLLLFFIQNQYQKYDKDQQNRVIITSDPLTLSVDSDLNSKIKQSIDDSKYLKSSVEFSTVRIKNDGTQDIADKSFTAPISSIVAYGNLTVPNSNEKNVEFSKDEKGLTVKYHLLPANQEHVFWIATNSLYSSPKNFSADNAGMTISNTLPNTDHSNDDTVLSWIVIIIVAFFIFGFGGVTGHATLTSELKSRGINVTEEMKKPKITASP